MVLDGKVKEDPKYHNKGEVISKSCTSNFITDPTIIEWGTNKTRLVECILQYSIKYGHPNKGILRIAKKKMRLTIQHDPVNSQLLNFQQYTIQESDEAIREPFPAQ